MTDEKNHYSGGERREVHYVTDKPTERGITLNNIISGLILLVAGWAANNIDEMNEKVGVIDKQSALNTRAIAHIIKDDENISKDLTMLKDIVTRAHPDITK